MALCSRYYRPTRTSHKINQPKACRFSSNGLDGVPFVLSLANFSHSVVAKGRKEVLSHGTVMAKLFGIMRDEVPGWLAQSLATPRAPTIPASGSQPMCLLAI